MLFMPMMPKVVAAQQAYMIKTQKRLPALEAAKARALAAAEGKTLDEFLQGGRLARCGKDPAVFTPARRGFLSQRFLCAISLTDAKGRRAVYMT